MQCISDRLKRGLDKGMMIISIGTKISIIIAKLIRVSLLNEFIGFYRHCDINMINKSVMDIGTMTKTNKR